MKTLFLCSMTLLAVVALTAQTNAPAGFVLIRGGTFTMGSPAQEAERGQDETQHRVTVSDFYMAASPVTQREYRELIGENPSEFKGDNLPVENVTWFDAVRFCNARSTRERLTPAYTIQGNNITWNQNANGYRLPTEAEWEYACRAGTTTPFYTGNNVTTDQANYNGNNPYNGNQKGIFRGRTTPVGSFTPNPWGLYDMHGNVVDWCWDRYGAYEGVPETDPVGPVTGAARVGRGGSWGIRGSSQRSAWRIHAGPSYVDGRLGFRLARNRIQ
jgi:formylglycine-generating enzyme required for sulfatase activity